MPRFVILTHDHPTLHWDLMLEMGASLRTWRLPEPPLAGCELSVEPLPDHRLMYLDYEGPVSGNRGSVQRWDAGEFEIIEESPDLLVVQLSGMILRGSARIEQGTPSDLTTFRFSP
ncbi:MAG: hypothetical protein HZA46_11090 [Planctomycetales bacterium]|nr:hypothetical protein [Planctomycetales bacterium]